MRALGALLKSALSLGASDLHLVAGSPAMVRLNGDLMVLDGYEKVLDGEGIEAICLGALSKEQLARLKEDLELDFALEIDGLGRFRANFYYTNYSGARGEASGVRAQSGALAAAFRIIPSAVASLDELGSPEIFRDFAMAKKGLILITGATGSGKSTTLAAILNEINLKEKKHIITIEDPIEFIHQNKKSLFSQRGVGEHTKSFASALKHALREDPDVILVGEMRDNETIFTALTAAETGHLVLATLHTNSAAGAVSRIISSFGAGEQPVVRAMLSNSLNAVISQTLVPKNGGGRVALYEILINTPAISNLIRDDQLHQIPSQMQLGRSRGMRTMELSASMAVEGELISKECAVKYGLIGGER